MSAIRERRRAPRRYSVCSLVDLYLVHAHYSYTLVVAQEDVGSKAEQEEGKYIHQEQRESDKEGNKLKM